ncbi:hypothetical protein TNCV_5049791 [Trichonephila clavipes]|nr:hypothetical protein TNCV_5049791 [Trichonephila clavipes]
MSEHQHLEDEMRWRIVRYSRIRPVPNTDLQSIRFNAKRRVQLMETPNPSRKCLGKISQESHRQEKVYLSI